LGSLCAAFNWASQRREGQRLIPFDHPLRSLDFDRLQNKAYQRRRSSKARVEEQVHHFLMHNVGEAFKKVLFALRHSGTRPGNICKVTADNFYEDPGVWVFEEQNAEEGNTVHKTYEATHEPLIVPLTTELLELCKRLCKEHPTGPLFRRSDGTPWTPQAIADCFRRYRTRFRKMGLPIPETLFAYCYRHEVATALIAGGETDAMTAGVLGHQGTKTLHKHYNHVLAKAPALVNALRRQVRALRSETAALGEGVADPEQPEQE
jgi:integrase